jgi:hypothetical protein
MLAWLRVGNGMGRCLFSYAEHPSSSFPSHSLVSQAETSSRTWSPLLFVHSTAHTPPPPAPPSPLFPCLLSCLCPLSLFRVFVLCLVDIMSGLLRPSLRCLFAQRCTLIVSRSEAFLFCLVLFCLYLVLVLCCLLLCYVVWSGLVLFCCVVSSLFSPTHRTNLPSCVLLHPPPSTFFLFRDVFCRHGGHVNFVLLHLSSRYFLSFVFIIACRNVSLFLSFLLTLTFHNLSPSLLC